MACAKTTFVLFTLILLGNDYLLRTGCCPGGKFYVLNNGSDVPYCGCFPNEACETLQYLLKLFPPADVMKYNVPINIVTDISVTINQETMESFPWLSGASLIMDNFDKFSVSASLTLDSVTMINSFHQVHNMNMKIINKCNLTNYNLNFDGNTTPNSPVNLEEIRNIKHPVKAQLQSDFNSALLVQVVIPTKELYIEDIFITAVEQDNPLSLAINRARVNVSQLHVNGILNFNLPVLSVRDKSDFVLHNSTFARNSVNNATSIFEIYGSKAIISNCNFESNNGYTAGVMHISNSSEVKLKSCLFGKNQARNAGSLYIAHNSNVHIILSNFINNSASHQAGVLSIYYKTNVTVSHTIFMSNRAIFSNGGCITLYDDSMLFIDNCQFNANRAGNIGGVLYISSYTTLQMESTTFVNNLAELNTGVLRVLYTAKVLIENCTFENNTGRLTESVISANNEVSMYIYNCLFYNNKSPFTGVLQAAAKVFLVVHNCTFFQNTAEIGSLIEIGNTTHFYVSYTKFYRNQGGSLIFGHQNASLIISNSNFSFHDLPADPIFVISGAHLSLTNSSFEKNRQNREGGIAIAKYNSVVKVTSCFFTQNKASKGGIFYLDLNSYLYVYNCTFINNTAGDGAIIDSKFSQAIIDKSYIYQNTALGFGGAVASFDSSLAIYNSSLSLNSALYGGSIYLGLNSSLSSKSCKYQYNYAKQGGAIFKANYGNISLENCDLLFNTGQYGGAIYIYKAAYLRLSGGICQYRKSESDCISIHSKFYSAFYTSNYTLKSRTETRNSFTDKNFYNDAIRLKMIYSKGKQTWKETPFASLSAVMCGDRCYCSYLPELGNFYNCSSQNLAVLPKDHLVPTITDWIDITNNSISELCGNQSYLKVISGLFFSNNKIANICSGFLEMFQQSNVKILDLSNNKLKALPKKITDLVSLREIKLAGNPFLCDCEMLWLKAWIINFTKSGKRVITDYNKIRCNNMNTMLILDLDAVAMGCFPKTLTLVEQVCIGLAAAVTILLVVTIVAISRRWDEVKWFMYLHFDILNKNDGNEKLSRKKCDAFLSYSNEDSHIMEEIFMKYDKEKYILEEDHGFSLLVPERDFTPGLSFLNSIADAVLHSRRILILLTKNYVNNMWCRKAFELAHYKMVKENKKYAILVLLEPLDVDAVPKELQLYIRTNTYIDTIKVPRNLAILRKRIRFLMPGTPLCDLQRQVNGNSDNVQGQDERSRSLLRSRECLSSERNHSIQSGFDETHTSYEQYSERDGSHSYEGSHLDQSLYQSYQDRRHSTRIKSAHKRSHFNGSHSEYERSCCNSLITIEEESTSSQGSCDGYAEIGDEELPENGLQRTEPRENTPLLHNNQAPCTANYSGGQL